MQIMEENPSVDSVKDEQNEITRSRRLEAPSHYIFQIKSYSVISEIEMNKCESGEFEVEGYKWKLNLYPNGRDENVKDHISLDLVISNTESLPVGWEVKLIFKFFIFDQIRDNYLIVQDGKMRRYHKMKSEYGIRHLLSHNALNESSNGYLVDDECLFGVEVYVIKPNNKGETLTILKQPHLDYFVWYIYPFSSYTAETYTSQPFTVKGRKWRLKMYPNGWSSGKSTHISLFLKLDESESIPIGKKIYAKYIMGLYNYKTITYFEKSGAHWFESTRYGFGFQEFLSLKDLKDSSKTYLQNDGLFVRVKIVSMSTVEDF